MYCVPAAHFGARRYWSAASPVGRAGPPRPLWGGAPIRRSRMAPPGRRCSLPPPRLLELYAQLRHLLLMVELPPDVAVFAVVCDATGQWFALAPVAHELSGRHGIRRMGAVPNPNAPLETQPDGRDDAACSSADARPDRCLDFGYGRAPLP